MNEYIKFILALVITLVIGSFAICIVHALIP
jgi:hypothetical protein